MRALFKTLFGDRNTLAAACVVLALEAAVARLGAPTSFLAVPIVVLGAIGWLARR